jgi:hypothetical protein
MSQYQTVASLAVFFSLLAAVHSFWSSCGISVAETLITPLAGRMRWLAATVLVLAASISGGLLGFAVGLPAEIIGLEVSPLLVAALAIAGITCDVIYRRTGRLRPYGLHKQVPITWARIFHPVTASFLYGARLGIGPITIPTTWLWYTALASGALSGVWVSVAVGVTYGFVKTSIIAGVGLRHRYDMPVAMNRLLRREWPIRRALLVMAAIPVGFVFLASCSSDNDSDSAASTTSADSATDESTSTTVASTSSTTTIGVPDLRTNTDLVLSSVPEGFKLDEAADVTGSFDINTAAQIESDPQQELTTLQTRGFVQGYSRGWSNGVDDTITVVVYDFATAEGATAYLGDGKSIVTGRGGAFFDVPEVPSALGFTYQLAATSSNVAFTTHSVAFSRSNRWYLVVTGGRTDLGNETTSSTALVRELANRQRALVEGA